MAGRDSVCPSAAACRRFYPDERYTRPQGTVGDFRPGPPQLRPGRALAHTTGASGSGSPHRSDSRSPQTPRGARHSDPDGRLGTTPLFRGGRPPFRADDPRSRASSRCPGHQCRGQLHRSPEQVGPCAHCQGLTCRYGRDAQLVCMPAGPSSGTPSTRQCDEPARFPRGGRLVPERPEIKVGDGDVGVLGHWTTPARAGGGIRTRVSLLAGEVAAACAPGHVHRRQSASDEHLNYVWGNQRSSPVTPRSHDALDVVTPDGARAPALRGEAGGRHRAGAGSLTPVAGLPLLFILGVGRERDRVVASLCSVIPEAHRAQCAARTTALRTACPQACVDTQALGVVGGRARGGSGGSHHRIPADRQRGLFR